ncbi:MAG TPA: BatA domain-containing protein, partial [Gemmataceae bacterium]|nr:BatA domain-containing protein [Gemmataceae bacterium]
MESFRTPGIVGPAAVSNKAEMFFANPLLLLGLVAVLIPPAVHFFSRRRYDEVDWGAMQFLRLTPTSRRKVLLDEWLLLVIRMAALGLLAVALAGPSVRSTYFNRFDAPAPRTTVILLDASGSMAVKTGGRPGSDTARDWATRFIEQMRPGDRVAHFAVKGDVVPLLPTPTLERDH